MIDHIMTLSSFRTVNENFKNASSVHSFLIAQDRNAASSEKSADIYKHVQDEAASLGLKIAKSEKFARIVQPGVCRRVEVPADAEGYQWPAIKRAISKHLAKKDRG